MDRDPRLRGDKLDQQKNPSFRRAFLGHRLLNNGTVGRSDFLTGVYALVPYFRVRGFNRIRLYALSVGSAAGQQGDGSDSEKSFHLYISFCLSSTLQAAATGGLPNCSINVAWLSKNSRRSGTPYFSMARRSTPAPKANPGFCSTFKPPTASTLR